MEDNRDLKTLLELLLEEVESNLYSGMCALRHTLINKDIITYSEGNILWSFLFYNRPKWDQYGYSFRQRNSSYWWKYGDKKPRIKFLKHWIKKLS